MKASQSIYLVKFGLVLSIEFFQLKMITIRNDHCVWIKAEVRELSSFHKLNQTRTLRWVLLYSSDLVLNNNSGVRCKRFFLLNDEISKNSNWMNSILRAMFSVTITQSLHYLQNEWDKKFRCEIVVKNRKSEKFFKVIFWS